MTENKFDKAKITDDEWEKVKISRVNTRPNAKSSYGTGSYTASDTKALFDKQGDLFRLKHNALVNYAREEEAARADAEAKRAEAEDERVEAENLRAANEAGRVQAEETREKNDQIYADNELARTQVENYRQAQETIRNQNEDERVSAETYREERFAQMETIVGDLDKGLDAILTTQELIIGGGDS